MKQRNKELMQLFGGLDILSFVIASRCTDWAIPTHLTVGCTLTTFALFPLLTYSMFP